MTKYILLASAAAALAFAPTAASASESGGDVTLTFSNYVSASSDASYDFSIDPSITGTMYVLSVIEPDSAASAQTDAKQIMFGNIVSFWDPSQFPEDSVNPDEDMGQPGHVANNATAGDVTSSGNTGVNVAAGQYNMQQNSANLSVSANADPNAVGGWANASTTGYQSLIATLYGTPGGSQPGGNNTEIYNYYDTNTASGGAVSSNGNVGENVAAGAFNQQQNLLTIAVANNSILSETSAALWQNSNCNEIGIQNETNTATSGAISGAGNLGVNIAAGVGNQQTNALTAAVSNATAPAGGGGTPGGV